LQQAGDDLPAVLQSHTRKLWDGGRIEVPFLQFSEALKSGLLAARRSGRIIRGIEAASQKLDSERRGLDMLKRHTAQGERVSRLLLMAGDGSANFYRKADRLIERHAPRVLGCVIDADSLSLGSLLFGRGSTASMVLVSHKEDVCRILLALMEDHKRAGTSSGHQQDTLGPSMTGAAQGALKNSH